VLNTRLLRFGAADRVRVSSGRFGSNLPAWLSRVGWCQATMRWHASHLKEEEAVAALSALASCSFRQCGHRRRRLTELVAASALRAEPWGRGSAK
jgi:hypothetical protein